MPSVSAVVAAAAATKTPVIEVVEGAGVSEQARLPVGGAEIAAVVRACLLVLKLLLLVLQLSTGLLSAGLSADVGTTNQAELG